MVIACPVVSHGLFSKLKAFFHAYASHSPLMSGLCLRLHATLWIVLYFSALCSGYWLLPFPWSLMPSGCIYFLVRNFSEGLWKSHWLFGFYFQSLDGNDIQFCETAVPKHSDIHQYHIVKWQNKICIAIGRCVQSQNTGDTLCYVVLEVSTTASEKLKQTHGIKDVTKATDLEANGLTDEINKLIEQDLEQSWRRYFRPAADAAAAPPQASGFRQCIQANFKSPIEKGFFTQVSFVALAFVGVPCLVAWCMESWFHFSTIKVGRFESTQSGKCMYANSMHPSCNNISSEPFYRFLFSGLGKNIGLGSMEFDTFVSRLDTVRWICNICLGEFIASVFIIGFNLFNPKEGKAK